MKRLLLFFVVVLTLGLNSCKRNDTINCTIYWQLYTQTKYTTFSEIEKAFQDTFFGFYERVNDNTVRATNTTKKDVRSLTLKLADMADKRINDTTDPTEDNPVEVRVFIDFSGSYIEEIWSKTY